METKHAMSRTQLNSPLVFLIDERNQLRHFQLHYSILFRLVCTSLYLLDTYSIQSFIVKFDGTSLRPSQEQVHDFSSVALVAPPVEH